MIIGTTKRRFNDIWSHPVYDGRPIRPRATTPEQLPDLPDDPRELAVEVEESCHAVCARLAGGRVIKVTNIPDHEGKGHCLVTWPDSVSVEAQVRYFLGGPVGKAILLRPNNVSVYKAVILPHVTARGTCDMRKVAGLIRSVIPYKHDDDCFGSDLYESELEEVRAQLTRNWDKVVNLAVALHGLKTLDAADVEKVWQWT